jgi:hypothetical protein
VFIRYESKNGTQETLWVLVSRGDETAAALLGLDVRFCAALACKEFLLSIGVLVCSGDSARVPFRIWFVSSSQ